MLADDELRLVLKELFITYETAYTIPGKDFKWMECSSCGERGTFDEKLDLFAKIKHKNECPVRKMRLRIREILNPKASDGV